MKYANFCDTGRNNINIGDYLQFRATDYLFRLMNIAEDEIVYLGFKELSNYDGEEVIFPICYSIIDFVNNGKIAISGKIKPIFFAVTLSTVDGFIDLNVFLGDQYNYTYLLSHSPIGCRDEKTYNILMKHGIPAYINGCMTAIFPSYAGPPGEKVLFVDAPKSLLPFIPDDLLDCCECLTQQFNFQESEIKDYQKIFRFIDARYEYYKKTAKLAVTSRLHIALPLTAFGIPVVLAKDKVDGRFSFIEAYISIFDKDDYRKINWKPEVPDIKKIKELLVKHALGRIKGDIEKKELERMENELTTIFKTRKAIPKYYDSHLITHKNGYRFDEYALKHWNFIDPIKYALWGASENNSKYWKNYIESNYPNARLSTVVDSFRLGTLFGHTYQLPEIIKEIPDVCIIVCSVGAAREALKLFKSLNMNESRYCITSDCFILQDDIIERKQRMK